MSGYFVAILWESSLRFFSFIAIKHLNNIGIFFHYIFWYFQLTDKQSEFSFAFRFVDDQVNQTASCFWQ